MFLADGRPHLNAAHEVHDAERDFLARPGKALLLSVIEARDVVVTNAPEKLVVHGARLVLTPLPQAWHVIDDQVSLHRVKEYRGIDSRLLPAEGARGKVEVYGDGDRVTPFAGGGVSACTGRGDRCAGEVHGAAPAGSLPQAKLSLVPGKACGRGGA